MTKNDEHNKKVMDFVVKYMQENLKRNETDGAILLITEFPLGNNISESGLACIGKAGRVAQSIYTASKQDGGLCQALMLAANLIAEDELSQGLSAKKATDININ